jgi:WD40 repeat protein
MTFEAEPGPPKEEHERPPESLEQARAGIEKPAPAPESSTPAKIEEAARHLALSVYFWSIGLPGLISLGPFEPVSSPSGECWVISGDAFDALDSLLARGSPANREWSEEETGRVDTLRRAFERVRESIVLERMGPGPPDFDEYDEESDKPRVKWYVIDGPAFPDFRSMFVPLVDDQGRSRPKPDRQMLEALLGDEPSALERYAGLPDDQKDLCLRWIGGAPTPLLRDQRVCRLVQRLSLASLDPRYETGPALMFPELDDLYGPPRLLGSLPAEEQTLAVREGRVLGVRPHRQNDVGITLHLATPEDDLSHGTFLAYARPCVLTGDTVSWLNLNRWETLQEVWEYFDLADAGSLEPAPGVHSGAVPGRAPAARPPSSGGLAPEPLRVSDPSPGELRPESERHTGPVLAVACAVLDTGPSSGSKLYRAVSASADGTLRVWDAASGQTLQVLAGHRRAVRAVALTDDGSRVVSASNDGTVRVWDVQTGELLAGGPAGYEVETNALALAPDGRRAVTATADGVRTWRFDEPGVSSLSLILRGHVGAVLDVAVTPDSRRIVSAGADGTLRVWDLDIDPAARRWSTWWSTSIAADGTLRLWSTDGSLPQQVLTGHTGPILAVRVFVTGDTRNTGPLPGSTRNWAVSASADGTLRVWDLDTGRTRHILAGHTGEVRVVALMPGEHRVISGSADGTLRVWDLNGGLYHILAGHRDAITGLALTPRGPGESAPVPGQEGLVYLSPASLVLVKAVLLPAGGWGAISASADGTLRLWDLKTGRNPVVVEGSAPFTCCATSPDGQILVAGDQHGQVHFLQLRPG